MATWLEDISTALDNLGGEANYEAIYSGLSNSRRATAPFLERHGSRNN